MDVLTSDTLQYWKTHRYKDNHLPFVEAVRSLAGREPLVEFKQSPGRPGEWVVGSFTDLLSSDPDPMLAVYYWNFNTGRSHLCRCVLRGGPIRDGQPCSGR